MNWTPAILALGALLTLVAPVLAQDPAAWDSPRALELIERARQRRALPAADPGLANYSASANGFVYFFLDRRDSEERTLVKVDQLALEVYWAAPNRTRQRIVGLRDVQKLPGRIYYHLDHLTVVQNEFDDRIRLGDGDEVRDVLHPAAPGADSVYHFRLADSLTIRLPGASEPVRVYEVEVKPRRLDHPALIGSVFLDRITAAIVRMTFTFTPASYVDRRLDYIRVSLDNGLWDGRYWLPNEQRLEIRRQVPALDFVAGGVIRGVIRVGDYRLNEELPLAVLSGPKVVALPRRLREGYAFEDEIFAGLDDEGLDAEADFEALRRQAVALVGRRYLSGLPRLRLYVPDASSVLRYNRAEGVYLGGGLSYGADGATRLQATAGYATAAGHLALAGTLRRDLGTGGLLHLSAGRNALRDLGVRPGAAGVLNTLRAAMAGEDFLDPYYATGFGAEWERPLAGPWRLGLAAGYEHHRAARLEDAAALLDEQAPFRPVRPVDEGGLLSGQATLRRSSPADRAGGWSGEATLELGSLEGRAYLRPTLELGLVRNSADRSTSAELRAAAGLATGDIPRQRLFLFGGSGTLPGYDYRAFAGDRFALLEAEASRAVLGPWVRLRAVGAVGWSDFASAPLPAAWDAAATGGLRASLGAGLGLFYDVVRLDLVRGVNGGRWEAVFSVTPGLRDIL